jgi:L-threonylcarbamoyladenylate synthase
MPSQQLIQKAARVLHNSGVIAYPTEGVFGLGCLPDDRAAVAKLLAIKGRSVSAGLILIAPDYAFVEDWIDPTELETERLTQTQDYPLTWIVTAAASTPDYLTGGRTTLAVRISPHPVVATLCCAVGSALISTSANRSGRPAAKHISVVRKQLGRELDLIVTGALGISNGPSEIRVAQDNRVIRARHVALSG